MRLVRKHVPDFNPGCPAPVESRKRDMYGWGLSPARVTRPAGESRDPTPTSPGGSCHLYVVDASQMGQIVGCR